MANEMDFSFEELINQLRSMLSPDEDDSSPLASAPNVIREAASHDFAQYRFLFPPLLVQNSEELGSPQPRFDTERPVNELTPGSYEQIALGADDALEEATKPVVGNELRGNPVSIVERGSIITSQIGDNNG